MGSEDLLVLGGEVERPEGSPIVVLVLCLRSDDSIRMQP
jgi:hypothetical protein